MDYKDLMKDSFYEKEKRKRQDFKDQFRPDKKAYRSPPPNGRRILLLDLLIIVILLGIIYPFFMQRFGPIRKQGDFRFHYTTQVVGQRVLHSLEVKALAREQDAKTPLLEVQFQLEGMEPADPQLDLAPIPGESREFTFLQNLEGDLPAKALCVIRWEEEHLELQRELKAPR